MFALLLLKTAVYVLFTYFFCNLVDRLGRKEPTRYGNMMWSLGATAAYMIATGDGAFHWTAWLAGWGYFALATLIALPLVVGFHVALFYTSRPIFMAVMNACVSRMDIEKEGDLYLRRWYLTPRFHPPQRLLDWLVQRGHLKLWFLLRSRYFLHWIVRSDDDRDPHDHPWPFQSRILDGEYHERVWFPKNHSQIPYEVQVDNRYIPVIGKRYWVRQCPTGTVLFNDWDHTHMVRIVKPVWSLVLAGPRAADEDNYWGFWKIHPTDPELDEWVHRADYLAAGDEVLT